MPPRSGISAPQIRSRQQICGERFPRTYWQYWYSSWPSRAPRSLHLIATEIVRWWPRLLVAPYPYSGNTIVSYFRLSCFLTLLLLKTKTLYQAETTWCCTSPFAKPSELPLALLALGNIAGSLSPISDYCHRTMMENAGGREGVQVSWKSVNFDTFPHERPLA